MRRNLTSLVTCILVLAGCAPEGPSAYVDLNLKPDSSCTYSAGSTDTVGLSGGLYDISPGGANTCENPYVLALRVNSQLRPGRDEELGRAEPNVLQVKEAVVKLKDRQGRTLALGPNGSALPNPFRVNTNESVRPTDNDDPSFGVVFVEAIPTPYAPFLDQFVNDQILVEVQLFGTTLGDVEVDFTPYVYPVRICDGCQLLCIGGSDGQEQLDMLEEDDGCQDGAGYDGRLCPDLGCGG